MPTKGKSLNYEHLLLLIFLVSITVFLITHAINKPRVLILHSYATDYAWVRDVSVGVRRALDKKSYSMRWHYMDTKRHPYKEYMERAGVNARNIIKEWEPHVIIAIDDDAQQFAAKYFNNDPFIKIVYAGVGSEPKDYGYDKARNVTGILERMPLDSIKEFVSQMHKNLGHKDEAKIIHITDVSSAGDGNRKSLLSYDFKPIQLVESIEAFTFDDWKNAVKNAEGRADFLMFTNYHTIRRSKEDKTIVPPKEVVEWTEQNTNLLTFNAWGFFVMDGGMMSIGVSPYEQGEVAGKMAIEILDNKKNPREIEIQKTQQFIVYLRPKRLKEKGIQLPPIYEAFARATNNYYE
jgi:ABC-type uncharacterized transport system substrate-binding protein